MHGGREQNYWPGFVDALSNVVLTLLFVIVVFVFALAMGMNKAVQDIAELAQASGSAPTQTQVSEEETKNVKQAAEENKALEDRLVQAESEATKLRAELEESKIQVAEAAEQKIHASKAGVRVSGDKIVINFPLSVTDLDDKSTADLGGALERFKASGGARKVLITSVEGGEPFTAAQRYAYYRAVNIRNVLIAKGIASAKDISSAVKPPKGEGGGHVEINF